MKKQQTKHSKSFFSYFIARDSILATISVFLVMALFSLIPINTHILDPFKLALHDFNYNDLAYSKMDKNKDFPADTNIVIVNIGDGGREEITAIIDQVMLAGPKVAGADILFNTPKVFAADTMLRNRFKNHPRLVMAYNLQEKGDDFSPAGYFYNATSNKGFANFVGEEKGVIRSIKPELTSGNETFESFSAAILKIADKPAYDKLKSRKKNYEVINYRRRAEKFLVISGAGMLEGRVDPSILHNKIVLLGYIGKNDSDIEDKHFTPFNPQVTGRGVPDMNGIFIHANIIGMAVDDDFIGRTPSWLNWLIAFLFCWIHVAFFIKYSIEHHRWYHLIAKSIQLIMAVLFVYLGLWAFYHFNSQINMTATLAGVILAVDVLYFYQSFVLWLNRKINFKTVYAHD